VSKRTRHYVWLVVCALVGLVYGRISRDWSFGTFYAGLMGVVAVVGLVGLVWMEFALDGAFRRHPQS
jgi:biotin transporter BioY